MEIRFKNTIIKEKHLFNFISIAMILTLIFQLSLRFVAKVEVNFTPSIFTASMLFLWFYSSKKQKSDSGK